MKKRTTNGHSDTATLVHRPPVDWLDMLISYNYLQQSIKSVIKAKESSLLRTKIPLPH